MKKFWVLSAIMGLILFACTDAGTSDQNATIGQKATNHTDQLNIYNWSDYVDPDTVKTFEKNNQIKVRYDFYDSNETLEAKILIGRAIPNN